MGGGHLRFSKLPYPQIERKTLSATLLFILGVRIIWRCCDFYSVTLLFILGSRIIWRCCDFLFCNPSIHLGVSSNLRLLFVFLLVVPVFHSGIRRIWRFCCFYVFSFILSSDNLAILAVFCVCCFYIHSWFG